MADEPNSGEGGGLTAGAGNPDPAQNNGGEGGGGGNDAPVFHSMYDENGVVAERLDTIPKEHQATRSFYDKYNSDEAVNNAFKSIGEMARMKGLEPLPGNATDAEKTKHDEHIVHLLGIPPDINGYGINKPEGMEDAAWEKMNVNEYLEVALKHRVTPAAMNAFMELDQARGAANAEEAKKAYDTAQVEQNDLMTQEFGGKTEAMYAKANQVAALLGFPQIEINSASLVKALNKASEYIAESKLMNVNQSLSNDAAGTYKKQADAIHEDPSNAFYADAKSGVLERETRAHNEHTRLMKLHAKQLEGKIA